MTSPCIALLLTALFVGQAPQVGSEDISRRLAKGEIDSQELPRLLEEHPYQPRLLLMAARNARREGRLLDASWFLDLALQLPGPDPMAVEEASVMGWQVPFAAASSSSRGPPFDPLRPSWPWWLAAGIFLSAMSWMAWRQRDVLGASAIGVAILAGVAVVPTTGPSRPSLPAPLAHLHEQDVCPAGPMTWRDGRLQISAVCDGVLRRFEVGPPKRDDRRIAHTERHSVVGIGKSRGPNSRGFLARLTEAVRAAEAQGYNVPTALQPSASMGERWVGSDPVIKASLRISAGLVAATLWILLMTFIQGLRPSVWRLWSWQLLLPLFLGGLMIVLVPGKMRMVYGGYDLTTHIVEGLIPRYGPGALWFYGFPQWLFGGDHRWIQALNRVYGLGSLVAVVVLARRWFPTHRQAPFFTAWLAALLPVIAVAHSSESIHPGPTLGVLLSLVMCSKADGRVPVAAVFPWLAAAVSRPEMAVMTAGVPVLLWWLRGKPPFRLSSWVVPVGGAAAMLAAIGWMHAQSAVVLASKDAVAQGSILVWNVLAASSVMSIFAIPSMVPSVYMVLVGAGMFRRETRQMSLAVMGFGIVWMGVTGVDHAVVSLPRIQLVPLLLSLPVAGAAMAFVWARGRRWAAVVGALYILGASYSAFVLWAPHNEDHEERLWREAADSLAEGPACLAAMGYGDSPLAGKTPFHNPLYLLTERNDELEIRHLALLDDFLARCDGPVYALLGMRCHAAMRQQGAPAPGGEGNLSCQRIHRDYVLEPIIERDVTNHGDKVYDMYPATDRLNIGLYRVKKRTE